ncbi:hypothetical protein GCM10022232_73750 [Streptomyces plumbiresistens]|uniref:Uncharacterized protein n=1 Tax=Streptomyces plumbiresistens TaxID=511811 RepID=A0ABP7T087_9ACTN
MTLPVRRWVGWSLSIIALMADNIASPGDGTLIAWGALVVVRAEAGLLTLRRTEPVIVKGTVPSC